MTVKITKPKINVREELNDLKKPTGIAGEAMLRAETPQEQFNLISAGRKNLIINGGFDVWQRGTSFAPAGAYGYSADRARLSYNGSAGDTVTNITKQTATVGGKFVNVLRHSIVTTANTRKVRLNHRLESPTYLSNQTATLSFWVRASRTISLDEGAIGDNGTGNLTTVTVALGNATTAWERKTATVTLDDCSSSSYLDIVIGHGTDGANVDIDYAMLQLELGKVATPFEHRSYGEELALCQRYYQKFFDEPSATAQVQLIGITSGVGHFSWWPPVQMRARPSVGITDTTPYWESTPWYAAGTSLTVSSISNGHMGRSGGEIAVYGAYNPALVRGTNYSMTAEVLYWDAEL